MKSIHAAVLSASFVVAGSAWANPEPTRELDRAARLVRSLGSPSFQAREKASKELLQLGRTAYPALLTGITDANPEVRFRCRHLLPRIYDLELQARLDAFLADTGGKQEHDLPGLTRFRKFFGFDNAARELFVGMIRADARLMDAVENQAAAFAEEKLIARCSQLQPRFNGRVPNPQAALTLGEVSQLLFLGIHPAVKLGPQGIAQINQFLYRPELRNWVAGAGDQAPHVKKLLLAWLDRNIDDANTGYMINNLAQTLQLKELMEPALKIATNTKALPYVRANVLSAVGRMGDKDTVAKLEPLIAEVTLVQQFALNGIRGTVQIGDVALAMAVHLSGQKPADYGYEAVKQNPNWISSYYYLGFQDDTQRNAAKKKWKGWQESQKKK
jgi:hypothetical protein